MPEASQTETEVFLKYLLEEHGPVETVSTHISKVFLARDRVLKLKRAVRFPYLDFSSSEQRLAACKAEFALNRRTAPSLYMGIHRISRERDGSLALDGKGELVDAVVEMRRFPEADLFDTMARDGRLTSSHISDLAHRVAAFHTRAPVSRDQGGYAAMKELVAGNHEALRASGLINGDDADRLASCFGETLERHRERLDERRAAGRVRRCHGDLTLRNICLFDGVPTPFDCIEFDETIATVDVLYDLAFALMDLWHREQRELANRLLNRYLDEAGDEDGIGLVPFFMAVRATIRAHVTATQAAQATGAMAAVTKEEANAYLDLARKLLVESPPRLLAVGGFSGSGKSSVAAVLAPELGAPPGARILGSDRVRKRLCGVPVLTRLPASAYAPEVSEVVYEILRRRARVVLAAGHSAIVEAVFDRSDERSGIEAVARHRNVPFQGVWLEAPAEVLADRIEARRDDPSDATADVLATQLGRGSIGVAWVRIDANRPIRDVASAVLAPDHPAPQAQSRIASRQARKSVRPN